MKVVDVVSIEELKTIYKQGVEANAIQVARVKDSEGNSLQFNIIVGKGLYQIGNKAIYVQPDHCILPISLFSEFYFPGGDEAKSKLGKKGRIRAVKFNFSFEGESDPIYSNGILIPMDEFNKYAEGKDIDMSDLQKSLNIIKYVADDSADGSMKSGMAAGEIPYFLYKTDENRCELNKRIIDECYRSKEILSFTQKRDGSSLSIFFKIENGEERIGVCSREMEKKLDQRYVSAYKDGEFLLHRYFHKETNEKGWYNDFNQKFYTDAEAESQFEKVMTESRCSFVEVTKKYGYLDKLIDFCRANNVQLALRGELIGAGNKGSGNKLNTDAKGESHVVWFGVDDLSTGFAQRIHYGDKFNLKYVCESMGLEYTQELFEGVFSYNEIIKKSNEYFKEVKAKTGQIIEGMVIRTKFSNKLSVKCINNEYDSKS